MADKHKLVSLVGRPGRPSKYSPELAERICDLMVAGDDLETVCERDDMPSRMTVWRWTKANPEFDTLCARARIGLAGHEFAKLRKLADDCTNENAAATRVKADIFKWRIMKLAPREYGDRVAAEISGPDGGPIKTVVRSDFEVARGLAFIFEKGRRGLEQMNAVGNE